MNKEERKNMNGNNFTFDDNKAFEMCEEIKKSWDLHIGAFKDYDEEKFPEKTLPKNIKPGTKEHANYLFWVSVINYQTVADVTFPRFRAVYEEQPEMFDPAHIRKVDDKELREFVEQLKHMPDEVTKRWRHNAESFKELKDDIRNIHKTKDIAATQQEVIKLFHGFQYKQSSLMLSWLKNAKLIETFDSTDLNIPVDVHVQRLSVRRDICDFKGKTRQEVIARYLSKEYQRFFRENREFEPYDIQAYMWVLGSEGCIKNTTCRKACVFKEPCKRDLYVEREDRKLKSTGKEYHGASGMCWVSGYRPFRPRRNKYGLSNDQVKLLQESSCSGCGL
ncbi:MAG: hypothetical protein PHU12_01860 [Candidatus Aenigmarchaeota archaeon]|nr:hypothetical protein [Candidatus Aenigmarchaeota archaeon]